MAGLILCRSKRSERPYYISNMAINIYSAEELCYYIYNNIYLVGTDLFDDGLIDYIDRELKEPELAGQLEFLVSQNAGLSELVITVLRHVDYYSETEIDTIRDVIDRLDTQNVSERLKARADNFLANKRYNSAIHNYEAIVYGKRDSMLDDTFYGNVWHNMGAAYAGMFVFYEAAKCFSEAYRLNGNDESYKAALAAAYLEKGTGLEGEEDELMYVTCREIETLMDHAPEEPEYAQLKKAFILKVNGQTAEYYSALEEIIGEWKSSYRNYIK